MKDKEPQFWSAPAGWDRGKISIDLSGHRQDKTVLTRVRVRDGKVTKIEEIKEV